MGEPWFPHGSVQSVFQNRRTRTLRRFQHRGEPGDDVQRVARTYLVDTQRTTGWFLPKNEETR